MLSWHNNLFVWLSVLLQWAHTHFLRFLVVLLLFLIGLRVNAVCFGLACATWPWWWDGPFHSIIYYFTTFENVRRWPEYSVRLIILILYISWPCMRLLDPIITLCNRAWRQWAASRRAGHPESWLKCVCCLMHLWKCSPGEFTDLTFHFQKWFKDH